MGFVPRKANPNEANQIMNLIVDQEVRYWPSSDRRFVMPSDTRLKLNSLTANVNPRDPEMSRRIRLKALPKTEAYCASRISNLIQPSRRIDRVLDTVLPLPKPQKLAPALITHVDRKVIHTEPDMTEDGIPIYLPQRASEAVGFARSHRFAPAMAKYRKPRAAGPLVKYAETYFATMGVNPYSNKNK